MLRYIGIVYADPEDPNQENPTTWIAATQGTYLPEGIYFNKELSKDWTESKMSINYPRLTAEAEGSGEEYYYYEFDSNGTMASGFDNDWLVLQAGTLKPGSGDALDVDFDQPENEGLKTALIFRRTGTTTMVNNPEDIK